MSNLLVMLGDSARSSTGDKNTGGEAEDVISVASLEVSINNHQDHGQPVFYDAVYSRGGWIWRTSHRYREWLALKETLKSQYGTRCLPEEETFPKKEDLVDIIRRLLKSCQVCHDEGGHIDITEDRRKGFEAYFAKILTDNREMWETSDDVRKFFSPGPPTSYSAALARRRREQIKEKQKAKEVVSTRSILTSSVRSTFGSLLGSMSSRSVLLESSVKSNGTSERGGTSETGGADLSVSQRDMGLF